MAIDTTDLPGLTAATKASLRAALPTYAQAFADVSAAMTREADDIAARHAAGDAIVPSVAYADIVAGKVPAETVAAIHKHGCAIVRGVFAQAQAEAWDRELLEYVRTNDYIERSKAKVGLDKYFSALKSGRPQIYGIYWSRPQIAARQAESMAATRSWLNRLWRWKDGDTAFFDPDVDCSYADRIRQREPGDSTLGLSPHVDGGTVERWLDPGFRHVFREIFNGNWRNFDPWNAEGRIDTYEIPSPAVCRMFRTYQGWTALTEQGPGNGTLQLLPIANIMAYILLRALQDDVPDDELCGAEAGRALRLVEQWHAPLLKALVPVPTVLPGDTVWWHPDVVHAVEDHNRGPRYSSVIYIGSAPDCAKNRAFLDIQKAAFLAGKSSPDFVAEDYEVDFTGRATEADLTPLGRRQMGFAPA